MRTILLLAWCAAPIAGLAYHYGPGQERLVLDDVATILARAESAVQDENWGEAVERYDEALKQLPADQTLTQRRLKLERAKAALLDSKLPTATADLSSLVEELQDAASTKNGATKDGADAAANAQMLRESREALANSQFYMTWLLRLEGKAREEWEPQIDAARQNYRLLAEDAQERGDAGQQKRSQEDLESAIRLERAELQDLQGLPLPSQ
jgi:hypothetical protein